MNKKRGFKRLLIVLPLIIGLFVFYGGANLWGQSRLGGLIWGAGVLLIYFVLLVLFTCWIVHWVFLGFAEKKPKDEQKERIVDVMDSKEKIIGLTLLPLGILIHFSAAILYGRREEWFMFGLSLTSCVLMTFAIVCILLAWKIDSRFNQLEKHITDLQASMSKDEQKQ